MPLLISKAGGALLPRGGFLHRPYAPGPRALITHGHADHARAGHGAVLATRQTLEIMAIRYGEDFAGQRQAAEGHCGWVRLRSAFTRLACAGLGPIAVTAGAQALVVSGDYARVATPTCAPFEPCPAISS